MKAQRQIWIVRTLNNVICFNAKTKKECKEYLEVTGRIHQPKNYEIVGPYILAERVNNR